MSTPFILTAVSLLELDGNAGERQGAGICLVLAAADRGLPYGPFTLYSSPAWVRVLPSSSLPAIVWRDHSYVCASSLGPRLQRQIGSLEAGTDEQWSAEVDCKRRLSSARLHHLCLRHRLGEGTGEEEEEEQPRPSQPRDCLCVVAATADDDRARADEFVAADTGLYSQHSAKPSGNDCQEYVWAQWRALCAGREDREAAVFSSFHTGPGQISLGCGSLGLLDFVEVRPRAGELVFYNYHGRFYHNAGEHFARCTRTRQQRQRRQRLSPLWTEKLLRRKTDTERDDRLRVEYCDWMNGTAEGCSRRHGERPFKRLRFAYRVETECDYYCLASGEDTLAQRLERHFPRRDLTLPLRRSSFPGGISEVLEWTGREEDVSGFVTFHGGREGGTEDCGEDESRRVLDNFGFCVQKSSVDYDELGPFTLRQGEALFGEERRRMVQRTYLSREEMTLARSGFRGWNTVSLEYFRWLVRRRGLRDCIVRHVALTRIKGWQNKWFDSLLQRRYENKSNAMLSLLYKLAVNSNFGKHGEMSSRYHKTSFRLLSDLRRGYLSSSSRSKGRIVKKKKATKLQLLGVWVRPERSRNPVDYIYMLTDGKENDTVVNYNAVSAFILNQSKVIFLEKVYLFLRYFDPRRLEITYVDTDSIHVTVGEDRLEDCFLTSLAPEERRSIWLHLFESSESAGGRHQSGLLKFEHRHRYAFYKQQKMYKLFDSLDEKGSSSSSDSYVRSKLVPVRQQSSISDANFLQDVRTPPFKSETLALRKTDGLQIVLVNECKSLRHALNVRRFATVSERGHRHYHEGEEDVSLSLQDSVHTKALR